MYVRVIRQFARLLRDEDFRIRLVDIGGSSDRGLWYILVLRFTSTVGGGNFQ